MLILEHCHRQIVLDLQLFPSELSDTTLAESAHALSSMH